MYVDVGGTKTHAASQSFDVQFPTDLPALATRLRALTKRKRPVDHLIVGLRGVWLPAEKARWATRLRGLAKSITIMSDIELAHRCHFGATAPGILLNAGTGSIAFGRDAHGKTARAGGLGPCIGDEGSGFWIGKTWLKHRFESQGQWQKVRAYAVKPDAVREIAGLANRVLMKAAGNAQSIERNVANEALSALTRLVQQVRKVLSPKTKLPVELTGSLFENRWFKAELLKRL